MAAEIKATMEGTWNLDRSENLEAYLDAIDIDAVKKKFIMSVAPTLTIDVDGEMVQVCTSGGSMTVKNQFKLGEEFDANTGGDFPAKAVSTFSDGKLRTEVRPTDTNRKPQVAVREIVNGELVQTMVVDGVVAKRIFKKA